MGLLESFAYYLAAATPAPSTAQSIIGEGAKQACGSGTCGVGSVSTLFHSITSVLLFLIGAISILMIIIGGLRYVLSAGDPKQTAAAKDTILYAIVGLVIALASAGIITFVTENLK